MAVSIRVLGPVEAVVGRKPRPIAGRNTRAVLAALVLGVDHAASVDHLICAIWGDSPPHAARNTLQTHVSALRTVLGRNLIEYEESCYRLRVDPDAVDSVRFERLVVEAAAWLDSDPARARDLIMQALGMWRGRPYGDLGDDEFVVVEAHRLEEMRLEAMEIRLAADIALGHHSHAAGILAGAVEDHPYRERLWYLLMTALAQDGRRVEAVRAFRRLEAVLAEVGLEPSHDVRDLEEEILVEAEALRARLAPIHDQHVPGQSC
jgi:DNA-binding SARP family transcriptional activator